MNCGTPTEFQFNTSDFTIELWGYDQRTSGDSPFLSKGYYTVGYNGNYIIRSHASMGLEFRVLDGQSSKINIIWAGYASIRNNWHHVVVSRNSGAIDMYIDGVFRETGSYVGNIGNNTHDLLLGVSPSTAEYLDGTIDEVRIYDAALEASQIKARYVQGLDKLHAKGKINGKEYYQRLTEIPFLTF